MKHKFLLCMDNEGYEASLEMRKLYEKISDKEAERHNQVRIIDESGEDYLYPADFFAPVRLPAQTRTRILERAVSALAIALPDLESVDRRVVPGQ